MKNRRGIVVGVVLALIAAYIISIIPNFRRIAELKRTVAALHLLHRDRMDAAVEAFKRDRNPTAKVISLRELVSLGYLQSEDIRGLEDRDVTVSLSPDEAFPQTPIVRAHCAFGNDIALMGDGSVQTLPTP
jgi:hypothetical protein